MEPFWRLYIRADVGADTFRDDRIGRLSQLNLTHRIAGHIYDGIMSRLSGSYCADRGSGPTTVGDGVSSDYCRTCYTILGAVPLAPRYTSSAASETHKVYQTELHRDGCVPD